jgi:hypothetical protein
LRGLFLIILCYKTAIWLTYSLHQLKRINLWIVMDLRQVEPVRLYYIIMFDITEEKCAIEYQDLNRPLWQWLV